MDCKEDVKNKNSELIKTDESHFNLTPDSIENYQEHFELVTKDATANKSVEYTKEFVKYVENESQTSIVTLKENYDKQSSLKILEKIAPIESCEGEHVELVTVVEGSTGTASNDTEDKEKTGKKLKKKVVTKKLKKKKGVQLDDDIKDKTDTLVVEECEALLPTFEVEPKPQTVYLGDEIVIECKLSPSSKNQVTWFKDGQPLSELKDGRIKINSSSESGIQTLKIAKALWQDVGDLVMIAENENGIVECTVPINVLSKVRNESLKIDQFICPSLIKTGGLLEINCHVSGQEHADVKFYKNSELLQADESRIFLLPDSLDTDDGNFKLLIKNVTETDSGQYTVVARKNDEKAYQTSIVTVKENYENQSSLKVLEKIAPVKTCEGEPVELVTVIEGLTGTSSVTWLKDGKPIKADEFITISNVGNKQTLKISNCTSDDAGQYFCVIEGDSGKLTTSASVSVSDENLDSIEAVEQATSENDQTQLFSAEKKLKKNVAVERRKKAKFLAEPHDSSIAKIDDMLEDFQEMILSENKSEIDIKQSKQEKLPVNNLSEETASNDTEDKEKTDKKLKKKVVTKKLKKKKGVQLDDDIKDKTDTLVVEECEALLPTFEVEPKPQTVYLGDEIVIECKLSPSSKNQVTWFKDGQPLSELKDGRIKINSSSESGIQTLKIAKALWQDVGDLVMIAENENGIVECTVPINVLSKVRNESLKIDQFICPSLIKTGGLLEINCHVSGQEHADVKFYKNSELLQADESRIFLLPDSLDTDDGNVKLLIKNVTEADSGQYAVVARKNDEKAYQTSIVTVKENYENQSPLKVLEKIAPVKTCEGEPVELVTVVEDVSIFNFDGKYISKVFIAGSPTKERSKKGADNKSAVIMVLCKKGNVKKGLYSKGTKVCKTKRREY
ncbi:hypothetical protein HELRODRAFT_166903 [Helobdella robusta]|uniref:Ig-like domain-containing protein n=1 Tax=Helobdella robusta TaxID=6412 RepID=T1EYQ7_HELRO|nr:hypothetical protein HELRODRAFT_166903 [Helobdella robusta]ESO11841.1 hypothetical protein HELRODRAFT_166903 [Helobdella robusta]